MEFEVLGPIRVRAEAGELPLLGAKTRTLLGMLLARANAPVTVDTLVEALWPGGPQDITAHRLQVHVSRLRGLLGTPDRVVFEQAAYRLEVFPDELDATRFESMVTEATDIATADPDRCVALTTKALALWRGVPYGGLDIPALADDTHQLTERRRTAMVLRFEAEFALGRHAAMVGELSELARRYPVWEHAHALLMTAFRHTGRQAEALEVYRALRRSMVDELGVEPGPEIRELHSRILAGEPVPSRRSAPQADPVPEQLPYQGRVFVGRDAELAELDELLAAGGDTSVITAVAGTAGVGKTALALRWAHRVRDRFPDGQLYVDLCGFSPKRPVAPTDALAGFLRAMGVEGAAIPERLDERAARYRSLVTGKRMLIVLDNVGSVEQARDLLPGAASCFTLLTSRDALAGLVAREGAHRLDLDRLSTGEAHVLLSSLLGDRVTDEPEVTAALIDRCARLPLALRVAAELIRSEPATTFAGLVTELSRGLDRLDVDGDPHTAVRAVFSWSYQHLEPAAARLFRLCGLHPGHDLDVYALAALAGQDLAQTRRALGALLRAHLIDQNARGRLSQHDLLRAYATELVDDDQPADRDAALTRLLDYYLHTAAVTRDILVPSEKADPPRLSGEVTAAPALSSHADALGWLDAERVNLVRSASHADDHGWSRFPAQLPPLIWRYLEIGGHYDDAMTVHTQARTAARALGDKVAEGKALVVLALTNRHLGRIATAMQLTEEALELYQAAGNRGLEATALNNLSAGAQFDGRLRQAVELVERSARLFAETGNHAMTAIPLGNLAIFLISLEDYDRAMDVLDQAITISLESNDLSRLCSCWCDLAELQARTGSARQAVATARDAVTLAKENGDRPHEAAALHRLATALRMLGEREPALRNHRESVRLARVISASLVLTAALNAMGESQLVFDMPAEAIDTFTEAAGLAATGVVAERGRAHVGLGDAHAVLGRRDQAREQWRIALEIFERTDLPDTDRVRAKLSNTPG
jgi:DNA-binding SARP family transcriptional activator